MGRIIASFSLLVVFTTLLSLYCDRNLAGSVTETGNVTGKVISKKSEEPVAGAKIALFKKKTSITSPDETFTPEKEIYSDSKGNFSMELDDGNYTIIAAADSEYAFVDDIVPGTVDAKGMTVTLDNPGALKGEIVNSLELRGTGSIVVHLIGTAIYQNVDNTGEFLINDIPAGTYTLVSYSTYQPEFSPDYRQVTIYPDSVTDLTRYELKYNGIPIPKNIKVTYDTANQVVAISWDAIDTAYSDFQEYAVLRGAAGKAEHELKQIAYTKDTVFHDSITFSSEDGVEYEYAVRVNNKLGESGQYYGIYEVEVMTYETVLPKVNSLTIAFDTVKGIAHLDWDSIQPFDGFGGFLVVRTIESTAGGELDSVRIDTLGYIDGTTFTDTLLGDELSFDDLRVNAVSYRLCVYHEEWKLHGRSTVSDTITIKPYTYLVPEVGWIAAEYDTVHGMVAVSWDSLSDFPELDGFTIVRKAVNAAANVNRVDTFTITGNNRLIDSIYPGIIDFDILTGTRLTYSVTVTHADWDIGGDAVTKEITIYSYRKFIPAIIAGDDQSVDISTEVVLKGKVVSSTWPIEKMEWKIGDGEWAESDSGEGGFTTNSSFEPETIICHFRVTDSIKNTALDSLTLYKTPKLVIIQGFFPDLGEPNTFGAPPVFFKNRYWLNHVNNPTADYFGGRNAVVWSSSDHADWELVTTSPQVLNNGGHFTRFGEYLYLFNLDSIQFNDSTFSGKSYRSLNGIDWIETEINRPTFANVDTFWSWTSDFKVINETLVSFVRFETGGSTGTIQYFLLYSTDGILWNTRNIPTHPFDHLCDIAVLHDTIFVNSQNELLFSSDYGVSWESYTALDSNHDLYPDKIDLVCSNDSILVIIYTESPGNTRKIGVLRDDGWEISALEGTSFSEINYQLIIKWMANGRLFMYNDWKEGKPVASFKVPGSRR